MIKLLLLYTLILFGIVVWLIPETAYPKDYFFFSKMELHFATHVDYIRERLAFAVMAYIIAAEAKLHRFELRVFFYLALADLIDYVFTYNETWFSIGPISVTMNITAMLIFGIIILRAWNQSIGNPYSG